jgi:L-iditol 2-dehydrogenase
LGWASFSARLVSIRRPLFGIDVVDFNLEKARSMGAVAAFNSTRDDVVKEIMARTDGKGVDITFLAFGNDACVRQAAEITRPGGTISEIAIMGKDVKASFDLIQVKELHVDGSNMYVRSDYEAVLAEIAAGHMKPSGIYYKTLPHYPVR